MSKHISNHVMKSLGFNPNYPPGSRYPGTPARVLPQAPGAVVPRGSVQSPFYVKHGADNSVFGEKWLLAPALFGAGVALVVSGSGQEATGDSKKTMFAVNFYSAFAIAALAAFIFIEIMDANSHPIDGLLPVGSAFAVCIFYFASVYDMVYTLYPKTFSGKILKDAFDKFFSFLYLSIMTFATAGSGDIIPETTGARTLVSMEVLFFIFVVTLGIAFFFQDGRKD